jgi:signal transduction histidine kinase
MPSPRSHLPSSSLARRQRPRAWFSDAEAVAVRDFWKICRQHIGELKLCGEGEDPDVQTVLELAVDTLDFGAYEAMLARWGERCAEDGLGRSMEPPGELVSALAPSLVRAHHDAPERLTAALIVMGKFLARRSRAFTTAFARVHERQLFESHLQLRRLAESLEKSREEERTRIARELHDDLAQQLTAIKMDLGWLLPRLRTAPDEILERLEAMDKLVDSIFAMVRRIGMELRPGVLDDLGLASALEWQAAEFERRSGIAVQLDTSCDLAPMGRAESTALFRIFQEILTNVARHAGARHVFGSLSVEDGWVRLDVTDDGRGIRLEEIDDPRSLGLLGMRERATLHGGSFRIAPGHGGGTAVSVTLPWTEATRS